METDKARKMLETQAVCETVVMDYLMSTLKPATATQQEALVMQSLFVCMSISASIRDRILSQIDAEETQTLNSMTASATKH